MSDISKEDQKKLKELGSVLIEKLSKDELRTLSLAHDCGYLDDTVMDEVNDRVADDFPEEFADPDLDSDIVCARLQGERDELEDIDNDDVTDKMILEQDDCHLNDVVGKVLTDEAREVLEQSYEEDSEEI